VTGFASALQQQQLSPPPPPPPFQHNNLSLEQNSRLLGLYLAAFASIPVFLPLLPPAAAAAVTADTTDEREREHDC
jgi:hypothetical protein